MPSLEDRDVGEVSSGLGSSSSDLDRPDLVSLTLRRERVEGDKGRSVELVLERVLESLKPLSVADVVAPVGEEREKKWESGRRRQDARVGRRRFHT